MAKSWLPQLLDDLAPARRSRRPSRKPARRTVRSTIERLEERDLLSASPVLTAGILSAPPLSPNGDGVQDSSTIQVRFAGATAHATQVGVAVENQAAQVIYQAPQVPATSASGVVSFTWDGKDAHGKVVADGTYTVVPVLNGNLFINPAAILVDTAAATVSPAAPADQSFARGTVPLSVTASDPDGISRVDFYLDQSTTPVGHGTYSAATQTWNFSLATAGRTNPLADGDHTWYARAYDNAGNSGVSATRTLRVDNTRPQVEVTNPGLGILGETHYTIAGTAADQPALAGYGVASVQVTVTAAADGTVLSSGPATLTPAGAGKYTWSYAYTPSQAGVQVVTVKATDQAGNTGGDRATFTVDHRPVVTLPAGASANEGAVLTATGSFADPEGTNPLDRWTATVNYGDGTGNQRLALGANKTFSLAHAYADGGTYTVTVRVTDRFGVTGTGTLTATVANVAPGNLTLTPTPAVVREDGWTTLAGTFADPGTKDTHTVTIHWGDGSPDETLSLRPGVRAFHMQHQYAAAGTDRVAVTVTDNDGGTTSGSTTVVVNNVAPVPHVHIDPATLPAHEGAPVTLGSTVTDPGPLDNFTYQWSITKDGKPVPVPAGVEADGPAFTFVPPDEGHYVVTLQVTDSNGASGSTSVGLNVSDTPPAVSLSGTGKVNEGSPYTLTLGAITDTAPGGVTRTTIHWGDGTTTVFDAAHPLPAGGAVQHTYADAGSDTIAVDVRDEDGTHAAVAGQTVTVADVAPGNTTIQLDHTTLAEGGTVTMNGSFTDPGTLDTHAVTIDWGDGSAPTTVNLAAGVLTFNAAHPYPASGTDSITVTVTGEGGVSDSTGATVTVNDVAPSGTVLQLNHGTIDEGGTVTLTGSFADPSTVDGHTATIDWGDGSAPDTVTLAAGATTFSKDHRYLDNRPGNAPYTIAAHVVDTGDGGADQATAQVTVLNVAPTPTITGAPASIPEGGTIALGSTVTDPAPLDTNPTYAWTVTKDGSLFATGTGTGLTFAPDDDGTYVASLTVTDKDGGVGTASQTIHVTDVAPTASIAGPAAGLAGQTLSFQGDFQDPGPLDAQSETFAWEVTNRTGQVVQTGNQQDFQFALTTPGSYVVSFRVTNKDGDTKLVAKSLTIVSPVPVLSPGTKADPGGAGAKAAAAQADAAPALATTPLFQNKDWGKLF